MQPYDDLASRSVRGLGIPARWRLEQELKLELPPVHRLYGVPVQGVARRSWNNDEFTGTFAEFLKAYPPPDNDDEQSRELTRPA
jgi:hypothetical protein